MFVLFIVLTQKVLHILLYHILIGFISEIFPIPFELNAPLVIPFYFTLNISL